MVRIPVLNGYYRVFSFKIPSSIKIVLMCTIYLSCKDFGQTIFSILKLHLKRTDDLQL